MDEIEEFLKRQEEMGNLSIPIVTKEIYFIINYLPIKKSASPDGFLGEFYQAFMEEMISSYMNFFQEIEKEGTLTNSVFKTNITLIAEPNKRRTLKASVYHDHRLQNS